MSQTLVAVFDSFDQAEQAATNLSQAGIADSDMQVHASDRAVETSGNRDDQLNVRPTPDQGDDESVVAKIERFFGNMFGANARSDEVGHYQEAVRRGGALLTVTVVDESHVPLVRSTMHEAGATDIDERVAHWKSGGYAGFDANSPSYTPDQAVADREAFSVVRESLDVGKREVETGGVRVYSRVTETPVTENVTLREEHATIERRPVDRVATAADLKDRTIEVRETVEHPVVAKTAHVVEEVVVGRASSERTETINETLRGTEVDVERVSSEKALEPGSTSTEKVAHDRTTAVDPLKAP